MSAPEDYEEEAAFYGRALEEACQGPARTLLELGSGGGNNASHLKSRFKMVLVEPSAGMCGGQPGAESRMRARPGRHANRQAQPTVRSRVRARRRLLHDDRGRPAAGDRDCVHALQARRRGAVRTGSPARELPPVNRPWRSRQCHARPTLPGMDVGSRSLRYNVPCRLRVPAAEPRRFGASGA